MCEALIALCAKALTLAQEGGSNTKSSGPRPKPKSPHALFVPTTYLHATLHTYQIRYLSLNRGLERVSLELGGVEAIFVGGGGAGLGLDGCTRVLLELRGVEASIA